MKLIPALISVLALISASHADDGVRNVQIDAEFIEVSEPDITAILHGPNPPKDGADWKAAVEKLLKEKKGKVTASLTVTTKSGQRASAESVQELVYPTEFDPAHGRAKDAPDVPKNLTGADIPTPTAFEMRPVGVRFEVEPTVGADGKLIDLNIAPEITAKVGEVAHQEIPLGRDTLATVKQPVFYTMKATTSVAVQDGGSTLASIFIPHNEAGENDNARRILCVVTARLVAP